mmetsp:Transcript_127686/g.235027  ORF Transcript_127686/g.235027 Transcript_127686/m.235027 type:complete len:185 (-) Transcript_127686:38-592(-)
MLVALPSTWGVLSAGPWTALKTAPLWCVASTTLPCISGPGVGIAWYNFFQDDYYLEDCYKAEIDRPCEKPRYGWFDAVYDLAYREGCMMARMRDPTPFMVKERQCYNVLRNRLPYMILAMFGSVVVAIIIGACIVLDQHPLYGDKDTEEAELIADAKVSERMHHDPLPEAPRYRSIGNADADDD